jgi:hypothetical protein
MLASVVIIEDPSIPDLDDEEELDQLGYEKIDYSNCYQEKGGWSMTSLLASFGRF